VRVFVAEQPEPELERFLGLLVPICDQCSREGRDERFPIVFPAEHRRLEICAWCGAQTREGVYLLASLAEQCRQQLEDTVGPVGRTIACSKTSYRENHPDRAPVFNANLALRGGKVWHGDLDLSVDEPALVELARRLAQTVFVLYERDGRFEHERQPRLEEAVYRVNQEGLYRFDHHRIERDREGILRPRAGRRGRDQS
jgi:hypothetical protein